MDKFYQIITELWPLIEVQNCVLLNIIFRGGVSCLPAVLLLNFFCIENQQDNLDVSYYGTLINRYLQKYL